MSATADGPTITEAASDAASDSPAALLNQFTRPLQGALQADVIDWAVKFERARKPNWSALLGSGGLLLVGAALSALVGDDKWDAMPVLLPAATGVALLLGAAAAGWMRTENLGSLCQDFLRYVDRWEPMYPEYGKNSDYIKATAREGSPVAAVKSYLARRQARA